MGEGLVIGRTPKPLTIAVDNSLKDSPAILELEAKGHTIVPADHQHFDLVLGPRCWRMDATLLQYLDLAVKGVRSIKYPKKTRSVGEGA